MACGKPNLENGINETKRAIRPVCQVKSPVADLRAAALHVRSLAREESRSIRKPRPRRFEFPCRPPAPTPQQGSPQPCPLRGPELEILRQLVLQPAIQPAFQASLPRLSVLASAASAQVSLPFPTPHSQTRSHVPDAPASADRQ